MDSSGKIKKIAAWLGPGSINIFGMPFAGKDTQGHRLADMLDAPLLGGGDILRGSNMPPFAKEMMRTGKLFPTDVYLELVLPYLSQSDFEGKPLVLSAVGRWHGEEAGVLEATAAAGHPLKAVVFLNMSEDAVWQRWEAATAVQDRGERLDDSYETLQVRLEEFRDKTLPAIAFYRDENLLIELDGSQATDAVTENILNSLFKFTEN